MSINIVLIGLTVLYATLCTADGQLLKLRVEPPFEFVNENWTIGRALPSMSVCVQYSGARSLSMVISSGDPFNYFQLSAINDTCWSLILQKSLDSDIVNSDGSRGQSFSLTFRCSDGKIQAYGNADVQVVDINDNAPRFVDTKSAVSVPEDTTCGKVIFTVSTFDPDTGVGGINSFLLEDDYKGTFHLRNGSCFDAHCTADILLNSNLNYDAKNVYTLTIVAIDGAGRSKVVNEARFPVVVTVLDVENNPPKFLVDNRVQFVPEDAPKGSEVFHVFAYDGDAGVLQPRSIRYSLSAENEYFGINSTSGWVFVKKTLDRENPENLKANGAVNLVIVAEEEVPESEPRPSSSIAITIIISDVDDEPPRCNLTHYTAQVVENFQRFAPVTLTNAVDLYVYDNDEAANGEFTVSLVDHDDVFDVTPKHVYNVGSVLIRVYNTTALDYELHKMFKFKLVLTPAATARRKSATVVKPTYCDISVEVLDANDNPPQFNKSDLEARVLENQPVGTAVLVVPVYDIDTPEFLPIVLKVSGVGSQLFYVDQSDGAVKTNVIFDREQRSNYLLTVTATDENGRGNSNSTTLRIEIGDENDNAPQFMKNYIAYLPENSVHFFQLPNGLFIEATDADAPDTPNSNVTYSLEADDYIAEYFHIDPGTGQILPLPPGVDLEAMPSDYLNFTVIAQDQGMKPLRGYSNVVIYVNDTNDNAPSFSRPVYTVSIYENATSGEHVTDVSATDNDRSQFNSLIAYRIVTVQDKFIIYSTTGRIVVAAGASLDRDLTGKDSYTLTVVALDQGVPSQSASATVEITIIDINDKPPKFNDKLVSVKVLEGVPVGTWLINVTAFDSDVDAKLKYQIVGYKEWKGDSKAISVDELVRIDEHTGQVFTTGILDREMVERLVLAVNVTDGNGLLNVPQTAQTMLELLLLDVNDNAPQFSSPYYAKSVLENAEIGSIILTASASDKDQNRSISYLIDEDSTNDAVRLIQIGQTTGEVTAAAVIDYEQIQWINFTVVATDSGVPPLSTRASISLRVLDQNDNSPIFHPSPTYLATLSEDSLPGTFVVQVSATDVDSGSFGRVSYFLLNDLETTPHFSINETTGAVHVIAPLDREIKPEYALTVRAVDDYDGHVAPGSHESTAVIRVTLTDVNDNAPQFVSNTAKVVALTENNAGGALVMTLAATDKDDSSTGNGQVRFNLVGGNGSVYREDQTVDLFSLDSTTGALRLAANLTGLSGLYWLTFEATDMGTPEPMATRINVTIRVQDYNDHRPVIMAPKRHEVFHVAENNYSDYYVITKLNAVDADEGPNSELHHALKQTSTNEDWKYFHIDSVSGDVFPRQAFDFERQNRYELTAQTCDYGQPSLCDEVEFAVVILDKNDNCPTFKRTLNYTHELGIKENQPPDTIVGEILQGIDRDTNPENTRICYAIIGVPDQSPFRLDTGNGTRLLATSSLDRETRSAYELVIKTQDCDGNALCWQGADTEGLKTDPIDGTKEAYRPMDTSLLLVRVIVLDDNDHGPFFMQSLYRGGVRYDTKIGSRVARVRAEDLDSVDAGRLVYSLNAPIKATLQDSETYDLQKSPFLVNETTGDIISNILFQPSWKGTFEVSVGVKDLAEHTAAVTVIVNLLRFDQQLELIFEAPVNQVWDEAHDIIKYLSIVTNSNATIDDVLPYQSYASSGARGPEEGELKVTDSKREQSKVLVHFVDEAQAILAIDSALQLLDRPRTIEQKQAKYHLISIHHLRYAAQNSDPAAAAAVYKSDAQTLTALAGVVGGLVLVMSVLIATWCLQSRTYKRKLKAASTLAFSSNDMIVPAYDLPGTNLHANSNPVWSPDGGHFSFENDQQSPRSGNDSLDDNELAYQIEKAARETSSRTPSTAGVGSQFFMGSNTQTSKVLQLHVGRNGNLHERANGVNGGTPRLGECGSDDGDSNGSIPPPPTVTMEENRHYTTSNNNGIGRNGTRSPQIPNFPRLVSTLESTEL